MDTFTTSSPVPSTSVAHRRPTLLSIELFTPSISMPSAWNTRVDLPASYVVFSELPTCDGMRGGFG